MLLLSHCLFICVWKLIHRNFTTDINENPTACCIWKPANQLQTRPSFKRITEQSAVNFLHVKLLVYLSRPFCTWKSEFKYVTGQCQILLPAFIPNTTCIFMLLWSVLDQELYSCTEASRSWQGRMFTKCLEVGSVASFSLTVPVCLFPYFRLPISLLYYVMLLFFYCNVPTTLVNPALQLALVNSRGNLFALYHPLTKKSLTSCRQDNVVGGKVVWIIWLIDCLKQAEAACDWCMVENPVEHHWSSYWLVTSLP